jgi:putative YphP/YqiW family bacilliredoxin
MVNDYPTKPDVIATVFASTDREAAARARSYFTGMPPSSPSFALLKNGELVAMIHRSDIEISSPHAIADILKQLFEKYCVKADQTESVRSA